MVNTYTLSIKEGGTWQKVTAVFPFSWGELLDERLDEGSVTFFSKVKAYKATTELRASLQENGITTQNKYFILATDNGAEYPAGSGKYKHRVYIIERTKFLDGILCSSLTFTNSLGTNYISTQVYAKMRDSNIDSSIIDAVPISVLNRFYVEEFKTPSLNGEDIFIPSAYTVGQKLGDLMVSMGLEDGIAVVTQYDNLSSSPHPDDESRVTVLNNGKTSTYYWQESTSIELKNILEITYRINLKFDAQSQGGGVVYRTFDFFFELYGVQDYLPLKRYSITDCILRVLECAEVLRVGDNPRFTFEGITYTNGVASAPAAGSQAEKYSKIYAPEFTMTQSTLREQLKVIGSYIHAEPYLDENNVVHYLEYGDRTVCPLEGKPYITQTFSTDINQYCTEVRSNVQNLISSLGYAKGVVVEPGEQLMRSLRTEQQYARINEQNGYIATDLPIYSIEKVVCGIVRSSGGTPTGWELDPVDITPFVFEATEYGSNLSSYGGGYPYSKSYAIYYTQGQRGLQGLFFQAADTISTALNSPFAIANILASATGKSASEIYDILLDNNIPNLAFNITYKPITSAFVSHGKQVYIEGEQSYVQIYNQGENMVESTYFGESMKGVAARLGNIEQERTYILGSLSSVPKIGQMLDGYAISAVHCEFNPRSIKCTVGLSKDFNRISQYVGINSQKRMYEISERQVVQRDVLYKEHIIITREASKTSDSGRFFRDMFGFLAAFIPKASSSLPPVKLAYVGLYAKSDLDEDVIARLNLPVVSRALGNVIHFGAALKDNYSAGDRAEWDTVKAQNGSNISGRFMSDTPYTDVYGRAYWMSFALSTTYDTSGGYMEGSDFTEYYPGTAFSLPDNLGIWDGNRPAWTSYGAKEFRIRKDNREVISMNTEIEYKVDSTASDIIIGPALAERCSYLRGGNTEGVEIRQLTRLVGKFERYIPDDATHAAGDITYSITAYDASGIEYRGSLGGGWASIILSGTYFVKFKLTVEVTSSDSSIKSWAIVTEDSTDVTTVVDEDGNVTTEPVTVGGELLLAGEFKDEYGYVEGEVHKYDYYFYIRR